MEDLLYPIIKIIIKNDFNTFKEDLKNFEKNDESSESSSEIINDISLDNESERFVVTQQTELSGMIWVSRFLGSASVNDLKSPFKENIQGFITALKNAGASVVISATFRPKEQAYLMRNSYDISRGLILPQNVTSLVGVNIQWNHGSLTESIKAATDMVNGYGIVFRPAFPTKHSDKTAIDMNISWTGKLKINKADGSSVEIDAPADAKFNNIIALHQVADTYGVKKLLADYPLWSDDGH